MDGSSLVGFLLTPKGPNSLWETIGSLGNSYNVNFHYDFLKLFLEVQECTCFAQVWFFFFFSHRIFRKKVLLP
jgi:hypothetical protein